MYLQKTCAIFYLNVWLVSCACVSSYLWMPFMRLKHGPPLKEVLCWLYSTDLYILKAIKSRAFCFVSILDLKIAKTQDMWHELLRISCFLSLHRTKFQTFKPILSIQKLAIWHSPSIFKNRGLSGSSLTAPKSAPAAWSTLRMKSIRVAILDRNSAVRCPAEMMRTYGLCRMDVADKFHHRDFTRTDSILVKNWRNSWGGSHLREIWLW